MAIGIRREALRITHFHGNICQLSIILSLFYLFMIIKNDNPENVQLAGMFICSTGRYFIHSLIHGRKLSQSQPTIAYLRERNNWLSPERKLSPFDYKVKCAINIGISCNFNTASSLTTDP